MKRLTLAALLAAAIAAPTAGATSHSVGGDCSFAEHGEVIHIDGNEYHCVCGRLTGPNGPEIRCVWHLVAKAEARRTIKRPAKKHARIVRIYAKPAVTA